MAYVLLANQTAPATPAAGNTALFTETTTKKLTSLADDGIARLVQPLTNANTGDVTANAANTYLTGSSLAIPPSLLRAGATFRWVLAYSKTAAGTATPIVTVVFGTAGTTADTARLTFTGVAQTAATDTGVAMLDVVCRSAGASGVIEGVAQLHHANTTTGLANQAQVQILQATSAAFDTTVASSIIGVCVNPGASGVWTVQHVSALGFNL